MDCGGVCMILTTTQEYEGKICNAFTLEQIDSAII